MKSNEINIKLIIDTQNSQDVLNNVKGILGQINTEQKKIESQSRNTWENVRSNIAQVGFAFTGLSAMYSALQGVFTKPIQLFVEKEQATKSFEILLGSANAAKTKIEELTNFAATTPFQLPEVINASKQLEVLTHGALNTIEGLRMVGNAAAASGVKIDELSMWFGRLYDGIQSGRPVGEALSRLQELGVVSGGTRAKLEGLLAEGKKGSEVWQVFANEMERYNGLMEEQSKTLGGKLSNLEDNLTKLATTVGGSIATILGPFVASLNKLLDAMNNSNPIIASVVGSVVGLSSVFAALHFTGIVPITTIFGKLKTIMSAVTYEMQIAKLAAYENAVASGVQAAAAIGVGGAFQIAAAGAKAFFASIGPIGWITLGITALLSVLGMLSDETENANNKIDKFTQKLKTKSPQELEKELQLIRQQIKETESLIQGAKTISADDASRIKNQQYLIELYGKRKELLENEKKIVQELREKEEERYRIAKSNYEALKDEQAKWEAKKKNLQDEYELLKWHQNAIETINEQYRVHNQLFSQKHKEELAYQEKIYQEKLKEIKTKKNINTNRGAENIKDYNKLAAELLQEMARLEQWADEQNRIKEEKEATHKKRLLEIESEYQTKLWLMQQEAIDKNREESERIRQEQIEREIAIQESEAQLHAQRTAMYVDNAMQIAQSEKNLGKAIGEAAKQNIKSYMMEAVANQIKNAIATIPFPANIAVAAVAGVAVQAIYDRVFASIKIPKFGSGGVVKGKSHSQGGVLINAEGGEYIVNKEATSRYLPVLEDINNGQYYPNITPNIYVNIDITKKLADIFASVMSWPNKVEFQIAGQNLKAVLDEHNKIKNLREI